MATTAAEASAAETPADWTTSLRVRTPNYALTARGPTVPAYRLNDTPGAPALPAWGTVVELPSNGDYEITFESPSATLLAGQADVGAAPAPDLPQPGAARPLASLAEELSAVPTIDRPDPAIYRTDAFYPASPVVDGGVQWQAGRRLLALRVFPFQYNPVTGRLRYHPDIAITVRGREYRGRGQGQETGGRGQEAGGRGQGTGTEAHGDWPEGRSRSGGKQPGSAAAGERRRAAHPDGGAGDGAADA